jgi:hypothetical protein
VISAVGFSIKTNGCDLFSLELVWGPVYGVKVNFRIYSTKVYNAFLKPHVVFQIQFCFILFNHRGRISLFFHKDLKMICKIVFIV